METKKNPFKPDYEDERLKDVEKQREDELKSNQDLQQELLTRTDNTYNGLNANLEAQTKESEKALEEQTNLSIQQMEQKKEQVDKDLASEQSAAYADYQKESNKYGANAERRAASGLERTGYSETSQTRMYEAYQNRVAVARSSAETAKQNYELGMQQARMQHSVALAEIHLQALQKQLELSIQGLNARNQIILNFADREQTIKQNADTRWQQVLAQINREIDMEEEARKFDEQYGVLEEGDGILPGENEDLTGGAGFIAPGGTVYGGEYDGEKGLTLSNGNDEVPFDQFSVQAIAKQLGISRELTGEDLAELEDQDVIYSYIKNGKRHFALMNPQNSLHNFAASSKEKTDAYNKLNLAYTPGSTTTAKTKTTTSNKNAGVNNNRSKNNNTTVNNWLGRGKTGKR